MTDKKTDKKTDISRTVNKIPETNLCRLLSPEKRIPESEKKDSPDAGTDPPDREINRQRKMLWF
jgi:hypothetical protein